MRKPSKFKGGTGIMGATAPGQIMTKDNVKELPPGSVVRLSDGGMLIHLHDDLWIYCATNCWCYDRIEHLTHWLPGTLCHYGKQDSPKKSRTRKPIKRASVAD